MNMIEKVARLIWALYPENCCDTFEAEEKHSDGWYSAKEFNADASELLNVPNVALHGAPHIIGESVTLQIPRKLGFVIAIVVLIGMKYENP